jgi:hypothetical protein
LGAGVDSVFLALEVPGVLPVLAFAESGGFVVQAGEEGDGFWVGEIVNEVLDVEGGIVSVAFADLEEVGVLAGDVG